MKLPQLPLLNLFRTSKVFAVVLGLHLFVVSLLLFHPGCQSNSRRSDVNSAPMGEATSYDNATLAEPSRPEGYVSNTGTTGMNEAPVITDSSSLNYSDSSAASSYSSAPATSYTVVKGDSLWSISRKHGVSINELTAANNISKTASLKIGQQLQIPAASSAPVTSSYSSSASATESSPSMGTYKVKSGDTLGKIAKANGISVRALKSANGLSSDIIRVGQKLKIPSGKPVVEPAPSASRASSSSSDMAPVSSSISSETSATSISADGATTHKVAAGESPAIIAKKYGMKTSELIALNNITDPRKLRIGQELKVKAPAATTDTAASTTTPATTDGSAATMSVEALEAATGTSATDATAPVVEAAPETTVTQ